MKHLIYSVFFLFCLTTYIPADIIVQEPPNNLRSVHSYYPFWQSFTAESSRIQSISFAIGAFNPQFPDVPVTVELFEGSGVGGSSLGVSELQFVEAVNFQYFDYDSAWMEADFSHAVLTAGNKYTALLSCSNDRYGAYTYIWDDPYITYPDPYTGGEGYYGGRNDSIEDGVQFDLLFKVASIPEPATMLLLALGGLALRRRK